MRRKDRAMSKEFAFSVIDKAQYGTISMVDEDGQAYGLPLSIVRDKNILYFHSAMEGKKVKALEANPNVSISFVGDVKVPDNYTKDQLDEIIKDESKMVLLISSVFTTQYESAIVKGKAEPVEDREEQIKAMKLVCQKYTPEKMAYFQMAIKAGLKRTKVYKVHIEEIKAKRKKYDRAGKEMKWERIE